MPLPKLFHALFRGALPPHVLLGLLACLFSPPSVAYWSNYETLEWDSRPGDSFYCLDIFDGQWNMLHQAVVCGEGLHRYSPRDLDLAPGDYRWQVWSPSVAENYAQSQSEPGFSGEFTVPAYYSTPSRLIWGQRGGDTLYCVDIFDNQWNMVAQAAACGEHLRTYAPDALNLPAGQYWWMVWSPSLQDYPQAYVAPFMLPQKYMEIDMRGDFIVQAQDEVLSSAKLLAWGRRGDDTFYCLDIFDGQGKMLHQAVACGEGLHGYAPQDLNLSAGDYRWKAWSPSVRDYFGPQPGFEGEFRVETCGLPYRSDGVAVQWGCREKDLLYCFDLLDRDGRILAAPLLCDEHLHGFYPERLADRDLPAGEYRWKVWSPSVRDYAGPQPGFEGLFTYAPPQPVLPRGEARWELYQSRAEILSLLPAADGRLWLGTGGGLELRRQDDGGLEQLVLNADGALPAGQVAALYRDAVGLWAATPKGLARQGPGGTWEILDMDGSGQADNAVRALADDGAGGLWLALGHPRSSTLERSAYYYDGGLARWRADGTWERIDTSASGLRTYGGDIDTQIQVLAADGRGGVWVGARRVVCTYRCYGQYADPEYHSDWESEGGLAHYDGQGRWRNFTPHNSGLPDTSVTALAGDGRGGLWIGLDSPALVHYDGKTWRRIDIDSAYLSLGPMLAALAVDGGDGVWVAMTKYDNTSELLHYGARSGWKRVPRANAASMTQEPSSFARQGDQLWVAGYKGIGRYAGLDSQEYFGPLYAPPGALELPSGAGYARYLQPDGRGGIWALFGERLGYLGNNGVWRMTDNLRSAWDYRLADDRAGGVWVADSTSLQHVAADGRLRDAPLPYAPDNSNLFNVLASDAQGGVWLGNTKNELLHYDGRAWHVMPLSVPQPSDGGGSFISAIAPAAGGVWVGLRGQLAWHDGTRTQVFALREGLNLEGVDQAHVRALLPDGAGGVWLGTAEHGLAHFDGRSAWRHWRVDSRLPTNPALSGYGSDVTSLWPDPDGSLWVGLGGGVAHLRFR